MFTGIVEPSGRGRGRPRDAGRARARRRQRPAAGRDRARRLGRPRRHLPDGDRDRTGAAHSVQASARDPGADHARRLASPGGGSTSSGRCGWVTSWAAIWCSATWTRWARSPAIEPDGDCYRVELAVPADARAACWRSRARSRSTGSRSPSTRAAPTASRSRSSRIPGATPRSPIAGSATRSTRGRHAGPLRRTAARVHPAGLSRRRESPIWKLRIRSGA